ncbi:Pex19 protein [Vararia minispora EC-137]|uniref:Pex19 protein n=1 Tax=Vararia minispora EC-137 TaxID=1314806 RepID=A0ACB8R0Q0_9AGAM|nr:Pex19 protein [Vararia minispora EC-137]
MPTPAKLKVHVDEDVDDLDDILNEFHASPPAQSSSKSTAVPAASTSSATVQASPSVSKPDADRFNSDFAEEFARQMQAALLELGGESATAPPVTVGSSTQAENEKEEAFKKAWERLLVEGMDATGFNTLDDATVGAARDAADKEDPFQKSIRQAMERLKESDANMQTNAADGDDDLQKLLSSLGDSNIDEDLHGIIEGMMGQLMSKDVLYDPLKELQDKFPPYMQEHAATLKFEDKRRYDAQIITINKIMAVFADPAYKDEDPEKSAEIVALMSEMQSHGSPPEELMGPLPPGVNLGADGMPKLGDDCKMQ